MRFVSWSLHLWLPRCQLGESLAGRKRWCLNPFLGTGGQSHCRVGEVLLWGFGWASLCGGAGRIRPCRPSPSSVGQASSPGPAPWARPRSPSPLWEQASLQGSAFTPAVPREACMDGFN